MLQFVSFAFCKRVLMNSLIMCSIIDDVNKMFVSYWLDNAINGKLRKPQEFPCPSSLFDVQRDLHSRRSFQIFQESHAFENHLWWKLLPICRDRQCHDKTPLLSATGLEWNGCYPNELECSCCRQLESHWSFVHIQDTADLMIGFDASIWFVLWNVCSHNISLVLCVCYAQFQSALFSVAVICSLKFLHIFDQQKFNSIICKRYLCFLKMFGCGLKLSVFQK